MAEPSPLNLDSFAARLKARRQELLRLAGDHADDRRPVELDQSRVGRLSRMDALQGQAMALEVERRRELELDRIDTALERIEAGDYGDCVECGEPIAPKRLELDPSTPVCIDCAARGA